MNILYLHQYFKTPDEPGGTRSYWIARKFLEKGHQVTMITTSSAIQNKVEKKTIDGIHVIYVKIPYNQKMGITERIKSFVRFMLKSTRIAWKIKNVDFVLSTSTPLTIGIPALILKKIKKIPYLFEVRDLWPEVPIQMGGLNNKILQKVALYLEKIIYKNAQHIVALSPGMKEGVIKYVPPEKVSMIPNMAKIDAFYPREKDMTLSKQLGLKQDSFKIVHFGALGMANGAMSIIKGAELMKEDNTIEFVFIGGGAEEEQLKQYCLKNDLSNVHFLGSFPMQQTSAIVNLCDISIVSFKDLPILYTNSPNKLFDSLSAGKPILVNSAGWTKQMVEKHNCGMYIDPHSPEEIKEKVKLLQNNPLKMEKMEKNARNLAETTFDKSILCQQYVELIHQTFK